MLIPWLHLVRTAVAYTRFYLPSTGDAGASPTFTAAWEETASAIRRRLVTAKTNTAMTALPITSSAVAGDLLFAQYVSDPLQGDQTIDQAVLCQVSADEALGTADAVSRIVLYVVNGDGSAVRGTLLSIGDYSAVTEWHTSLRNKIFADGRNPTSVAALNGDRLVLEVGANHAAAAVALEIEIGDSDATDLAVSDETVTATNNPWLQIQQALTFQSVGARTGSMMRLMGVGF